MHGLRYEYQDRVNFVILDYDRDADSRLAQRLGVRAHPAYAVVGAGGSQVVERRFGPLDEAALRAVLDSATHRP